MTEINQDFSMYAGDTVKVDVTMDKDIPDGSSIKWAAMGSPSSDTKDIQKDSTDGIAFTGKVFTITLDSSDTADLLGGFYHEAELTDADGNISTVMVGNMTVLPSGVGA